MQDLLAVDDIINFWNAEKWGTIPAREAMMAGGTFYGVAPALWVDCTPLPYYQIVYNKTLVENAGLTVWTTMESQLMSLSVVNLIERYAGIIDTAVENHIVPNKVAL